jgi:hypothetical protein
MLTTLALLAALQAESPDVEAEFKALHADYLKAEQEFWRPWREARTDEERQKLRYDASKHPAHEYLAKFRDLAGRAKGTDTAAKALQQVVRLGSQAQRRDDAAAALDTLVADHVESPAMEALAQELRYASYSLGFERVTGALRRIVEKSPHAKARAAASFSLAATLMGRPGGAEEAKTLFETLKKDYADTGFAKMADGYLFELENLQVGKVAPDFEAVDQDGKAFRLSDYRGKVVVLDFWGFW